MTLATLARRAVHALVAAALLSAGCSEQGLRPAERSAATCRSLDTADGAGDAVLHWTVVSDSAGRAVLDAYCAGVGPALVHSPADASAAGSDRLVIVAWNIALGAGDSRRLIADLRAGVHTDGVPVSAFVLLLQEVPRIGGAVPARAELPQRVRVSAVDPVHPPDVLELARAERLHLLYVPSMREGLGNGLRVDHGTAVLSTLPLADLRAIEMPAGIRRRVATLASVEWPHADGPLRVVSVHLDNFSPRRPIGSFGGVRGGQARGLARALPRDGVLVLGGDLNTWALGSREEAFRVLRRRLPRPAELQPEATARRLGVPRRLDYLLADAPADWHFGERRIADRYGSDHHPLIAELVPPQP